MTDVFISYKKADAGRVVRLVEALRAEGLTVWWDHGIQAGSEWDRSIHQALYAAKVVVAIWSNESVTAPWVKEEATVGKNRGVLLPVKIDDVEPPLGFMMIQAADLVGWSGDRRDPRWQHLLGGVRAIVAKEAPALADAPLVRAARTLDPPAHAPGAGSLRTGILGAAIACGLLLLAGGTWLALRDLGATPGPATPSTPARPEPPPPPAPPPAPPPISLAEQQLWDRAMTEKTRQAFQTYLIAYPNGAYAQRARDILLTCRIETREVWKPGPAVANQMLRGVSTTRPGASREEACTKARGDVHAMAKNLCETIAHNGGYRNPKWVVTDRDCDCKDTSPQATVCIADLPYSCMWEMKVTEQVDVCGGG